jgi:PLD-like domain
MLYGQNMTIFGSSNWTSASATSQYEHNYFTTKSAIFQWFASQFARMWGNTGGATETATFTPLPPNAPSNRAPASGSNVSTSTATLTWYGGPWAHNYDIYFGPSSNPPLIASNVNLGPSATSTTLQKFTTPALTAGTTYYWKIVSKTMANRTARGPLWSFTAGVGSTGSSLPSGWSHAGVGAVGVAGSASYSSGTFSVTGSGADIWGSADAFHTAYQSLTGDGQMVARVASLSNVASWTKAGVMIRSSLAPYWVKIVRSGSTVTGYTSSNGSTWTHIGSASISMGSTVQIGLAVSSHNNSALATGRFDSVTH